MFFLSCPDLETIEQIRSSQAGAELSYGPVGLAAGEAPPGFVIDDNRTLLGSGDACWEAGVAAMGRWAMFELPWLSFFPGGPPEEGRVVAVRVRSLGLWMLGFNRVVYTFSGPGRAGFAYGTLPHHVECGEERFQLTRDAEDRVWFEIRACSQPRHPLAQLGRPWVRREQRRFARDALAAFQRAVSGPISR